MLLQAPLLPVVPWSLLSLLLQWLVAVLLLLLPWVSVVAPGPRYSPDTS